MIFMKARCSLQMDFKTTDDVKKIIKAVRVDDLNFVKTTISGKKLNAKIDSNSISSLLHTLDDYLACVSVASKIVYKD